MPRQVRPIRICGDVAYVTLTQGYEAIIDAADVPLFEPWSWFAVPTGGTVYAVRSDYSGTNMRTVYAHRTILGEPYGLDVDHKDGDGLNNRRENLRPATKSQNMRNRRINLNSTSGFKGVYFHRQAGKWAAQIKIRGKAKYLGLFASPEKAHSAYCTASRELHGEFGRTS
tara:strand:- start:506 stop:1015 length:510 start_codon:yes stop_codon:yes gene_type:complete